MQYTRAAVLAKITTVGTAMMAVVLALVPFHALLTVAAAALAGHYGLWRLWKEILMLVFTPLAIWLVCRTPGLWRQLRSGWLLWAVLCYGVLQLALGLLALGKGQVNSYALLYALAINLRPMLALLLAWAVAARCGWLHGYWRQLLAIPAAVVVGFGVLQALVLPADFLKHFGYSQATIPPFETVDQKLQYIRIQSTLRGANPLGAYMVLVLGAALVLLRRSRDRLNLGYGLLLVAGLCVLLATYSRSAYIGFGLTALTVLVLAVRSQAGRRRLAAGIVVLALLGAGLLIAFRNNDRVENTFFHTDEHSLSATSSNQQRASALETGLHDVLTEPFGRGPGTAGPASVHNTRPARIAEDYYLQVGQETGWLGLGLFVAIVVMVGKRLWHRRHDPLARAMLVSLVGISFINLLSHAWADDTLAVVWWGFAGVAIATPLAASGPDAASSKTKRKTTKQ